MTTPAFDLHERTQRLASVARVRAEQKIRLLSRYHSQNQSPYVCKFRQFSSEQTIFGHIRKRIYVNTCVYQINGSQNL